MADGPKEKLYVENTRGGDVSVVDIPSFEVTGSIPVGEHPDDVLASADGETIYVNRQGPRDLVAVDLASGEIAWTVQLEGIPHHLGLAKDGEQVYVALYNELRDNVVDVASQQIVERPFTGFGSHGVHIGEQKVYVGSMVMDHLAVLDAATYQLEKFIPFPEAVRPFDTADEEAMYLQLSKRHGFVVADLESGEIVREVDLPELPAGTEFPAHYPHTVNHGLRITPDRRHLLAAGSIAGYVCVYTVPGLEHVKTIDVGEEPNWIVFSSDDSLAYITNRAEDTVSVISLSALEEIERIKVGQYPQRMAVVAG